MRLPLLTPSGNFRDPGRFAKLAGLALLLFVIAAVVSMVSSLAEINLLNELSTGRPRMGPGYWEWEASAEAANNDRRVAIVTFVQIGSYVLAGVFFLLWQHRLFRNLEAGRRRVTSAWRATAGWFIPVANLWLPYSRMNELWEGVRAPNLVGPWWFAFVVSGGLTYGAGLVYAGAVDAAGFITANWIAIAADALSALAAVAAAALVAQVTAGHLAASPRRMAADTAAGRRAAAPADTAAASLSLPRVLGPGRARMMSFEHEGPRP